MPINWLLEGGKPCSAPNCVSDCARAYAIGKRSSECWLIYVRFQEYTYRAERPKIAMKSVETRMQGILG